MTRDVAARAQEGWHEGPVRPLAPGDDVSAPAGTIAEVEHVAGSIARLDAGGLLHLEELAADAGSPDVAVWLQRGLSWHRLDPDGVPAHRYEVRTPEAVAVARAGSFAVERAAGGESMFVCRRGVVIVRPAAGRPRVLHEATAVTVDAAGRAGDVCDVDPADLARHEWIRMNELLDGDAELDLPETPPEPVVSGQEATSAPAPLVGSRRRRWIVGVAATTSLALAGGVAIALSAHGDGRTAAPGPPAGRTEASRPGTGAPPSEAPATSVPATAPSTTAVPTSVPVTAAPAPSVDDRDCRRTGSTVTYSGAVTNHSGATAVYAVHVAFLDTSGRAVGSVVTRTGPVGAGKTATVTATLSGTSVGRVGRCEVGAVDVVS